MNLKVGILREESIETFGWISTDLQMIRSADGAVWIQLCDEMTEAEKAGAPPPEPSPEVEEEAELPVVGEDRAAE